MRNYFAFHYTGQRIRDALERHAKANDLRGTLIAAGYSGFGRYSIADHLALSATQQLLGATRDDFNQKYAEARMEALKLAWALFHVVDDFLFQIIKGREDAIIRHQDGEIVILPEWRPLEEKKPSAGGFHRRPFRD